MLRQQLTKGMSEGDRLTVYPRVRDEIRSYVASLPELLAKTPQAMA
jgi:hypothetical protein